MFKKYIIQSLLIFFEILLVPGLITLCSNSWSIINDFNEFLNRFLTFTVIYEFLVHLHDAKTAVISLPTESCRTKQLSRGLIISKTAFSGRLMPRWRHRQG